jgi:hypothetical protein
VKAQERDKRYKNQHTFQKHGINVFCRQVFQNNIAYVIAGMGSRILLRVIIKKQADGQKQNTGDQLNVKNFMRFE